MEKPNPWIVDPAEGKATPFTGAPTGLSRPAAINSQKKQIELASSGEKESSLRPSEVSYSAKKSLESSRSSSGIKITNTATLAEELATTFSEGEIKSVIDGSLPKGVTAQKRSNGKNKFTFVMNFTEEEKTVSLGKEEYVDMLSGESVSKEIQLDKYGVKILKQ